MTTYVHADGGILACAPSNGGNPSSLPWLKPPEPSDNDPISCEASSEATILPQGEGGGFGVGNPIHLLTGNKYQREIDMLPLPGIMGLEVFRYYNSQHADSRFTFTGVGRGWRLGYDVHLVLSDKAIQLLQPDGSRIIFSVDPNKPLICATNRPEQGTISIDEKNINHFVYEWKRPDGWILSFNAEGRLRKMKSPSGAFISVRWHDAQRIADVMDFHGRKLDFFYGKTPEGLLALARIKTPIGILHYEYDKHSNLIRRYWEKASIEKNHEAALVKIEPAIHINQEALYHYDNAYFPSHLTGISIRAGNKDIWKRRSTWQYDAQGRAISSIKGDKHDGEIEKIQLNYSLSNKVRLINSLGQETIYDAAIISGEYRLLSAMGAGCASCGETQVRYGYDNLGRLIEKVHFLPSGIPNYRILYTRDNLGRYIRWEKQRYREKKWQISYDYRDFKYEGLSYRPTWILAPSRVSGKTYAWRYDYNHFNQIIKAQEIGWQPATQENTSSRQIERHWLYRYAIINGQSLLIE